MVRDTHYDLKHLWLIVSVFNIGDDASKVGWRSHVTQCVLRPAHCHDRTRDPGLVSDHIMVDKLQSVLFFALVIVRLAVGFVDSVVLLPGSVR